MYGIRVHFYIISIIQMTKPNIFPNILCAASANPFSRSNSGKVGEMHKDNQIQLQIVVRKGWCGIIDSLKTAPVSSLPLISSKKRTMYSYLHWCSLNIPYIHFFVLLKTVWKIRVHSLFQGLPTVIKICK